MKTLPLGIIIVIVAIIGLTAASCAAPVEQYIPAPAVPEEGQMPLPAAPEAPADEINNYEDANYEEPHPIIGRWESTQTFFDPAVNRYVLVYTFFEFLENTDLIVMDMNERGYGNLDTLQWDAQNGILRVRIPGGQEYVPVDFEIKDGILNIGIAGMFTRREEPLPQLRHAPPPPLRFGGQSL